MIYTFVVRKLRLFKAQIEHPHSSIPPLRISGFSPEGLHYYVDPGSGFVFVQSASFLWGIILGILGGSFFFLGIFLRFFKRFFWWVAVLLIILIMGGILMHRPVNKKKVVILGIDGMDPSITEKLIEEGKLPNLSNLKMRGSYSRLATVIPSETSVVWPSFATGLNPGQHGLFDFIMRDPRTYLPYLSLADISNVKKISTRRKGEAFWNRLSRNNIPCLIYFCPVTFPPDKILGKMVSGMGVPDILGTMGRFCFYTTKPLSSEDLDSRGRVIQVKLDKDIIETQLYGPKVSSGSSQVETKIPLKIVLQPNQGKIILQFQKNLISLNKNSWSLWQKVSFNVGTFKKIHGIVRFYFKAIDPEFELYASPINFDPQRPPFYFSYPYDYSKKLAKKIGLYYTQGMPHDTWALSENRLDEKVFLELVDEVLKEKKKILGEGLKEFKSGVFFSYFEALDVIQHMFWRYLDPLHPAYEKDSVYADIIFKYYEKIDQIVGEVVGGLDKDTTLFVFSDHGFNSFRRAVHLNRWLFENGYLFLKEGANESKEFFENVDWSRTKAYALGFGGIYLNRIGREYYGIVSESEVPVLKKEIISGLKQLRDPNTGEVVVNNVYDAKVIYHGPYVNDAPDLSVGFNAGYRASWQTALGGVPSQLIEDNKKKWSGDHLIDPSLVPGVIFVNKKIDINNPTIIDIAPTILNLFGIAKSDDMEGRILLKHEDK
jgi:predicted AlkP superfamily phosphohydrolase/phosphomutase